MILNKDWRKIDFSFGLIYPNIKEIGLSSYSIRLLYDLINSHENIACERIFLPERVRYPARAHHFSGDQLKSHENQRFVKNFDILGFSLQYENDFKNVLWILENAELPLTRKKRREEEEKGVIHPLIIAGGPVATSNPLPFSKFIDLFFIGDSEPNLNDFFHIFQNTANVLLNKQNLLEKLNKVPGLYVPSMNKNIFSRAFQEKFDPPPLVRHQPVPGNFKTKGFENTHFVEINRGCPFKCKFCISSFHNHPFRYFSYEDIIKAIDYGIEDLKVDKISFIGPCVSAHPRFIEICKYVIQKGRRFSLPSIRIDHLNSELIGLLEQVNTRTVTIAPETGSEELRFALGKKISDDLIYSVVKAVKNSTIRNIKFYFLVGLPEEKEDDIQKLVDMVKRFDEMVFEKDSLRVNVNPLVPKLNTPYERNVRFYLEENSGVLKSRLKAIEMGLSKIPAVKLKFKKIQILIKEARFQALVALGDESTGDLLKLFYKEGANFGSLRRAEELSGINIDAYFKRVQKGYIPWKLRN